LPGAPVAPVGPDGPTAPAGPLAPLRPDRAAGEMSLSLSVLSLTSLVLTELSVMSAPVTLTAAYDVPAKAMTSAAVDATLA